MNDNLFVMHIIKTENYKKLTMATVKEHVNNIRKLDEAGQLEFCGIFKGYKGVAGMLIIRAENKAEANKICQNEPLVLARYATYELYPIQAANKENNYLLK